jgi:hypothetical protein
LTITSRMVTSSDSATGRRSKWTMPVMAHMSAGS